MKLSPAGNAALEQREGLRLFVYLDSAGKKTAGMGHRLPDDTTLSVGDTITQAQLDQWGTIDVVEAANAVSRLVTVSLNQDQFDALVSFVFNVGSVAFAASTLLKLLNAGDTTGAQAEFVKWHYKTVNGKKVPDNGLLNRRLSEAAQFGAVQPALVQAPVAQPPVAETAPSRPIPPPNKITQTTTGKLQVGALVSGGTAAVLNGIHQAQPVLAGVQSANSALNGMPEWLKIVSGLLVAGCIGACAATLVHKQRSL